MKPAGFLLLIPAGLIGAGEATEPRASLVSRELKAHIREGLPVYQPPPPAAASDTAPESETPAPTPTDPNVLILPKFMIKEKRLPRDAADHLMSRADYNRKMRNLYDDEVAKDGALSSFLNSFTIPILSPSRLERGRAIARGQELDRLANLLTPEEARSLNGMYDELALTLGRRAPKRR